MPPVEPLAHHTPLAAVHPAHYTDHTVQVVRSGHIHQYQLHKPLVVHIAAGLDHIAVDSGHIAVDLVDRIALLIQVVDHIEKVVGHIEELDQDEKVQQVLGRMDLLVGAGRYFRHNTVELGRRSAEERIRMEKIEGEGEHHRDLAGHTGFALALGVVRNWE
jgi:hypothetical protein